jgi:hypothetical protein
MLSAAQAAAAQEWENTLGLYVIGVSVDGDASLGSIDEQLDVSFDQILDNLQMTGMVHYRGQGERWTIVGDGIFLALGNSKDLPRRSADLDMLVLELDGGYRFTNILEGFAGLRYTDISVAGTLEIGPLEQRLDESAAFWDPIIGLRVLAPLSERWRLQAQGDIGGFGVGMDLTWQAMAHLSYRASNVVSVWLGYRALAQDFSAGGCRGSLDLDAVYHGPELGVGFHF